MTANVPLFLFGYEKVYNIMGILSFLFGNTKELPFRKTISFERKKSDYDIKIGDELNIWNKPQTNQINLYALSSIGAEGLVGTSFNDTISYHLQNTNDLFIENKIVSLSENSIALSIYLFADSNAVKQNYQDSVDEWERKIMKKYTPKSNWTIRFYSENLIDKNNILVNTIHKESIKDFYTKANEAIWLTDKNGNKIDAENRIYSEDTNKTLRSIFSGHQLEILAMYRDNNYYTFEIGIKK